MAEESNDHVSEAPHPYGVIGKSKIPAGTPALAPDGLPWPEGYFEKAPRISVEEAAREFGVRPSRYRNGRPWYTVVECENPKFTPLPDESAWLAELEKEADRRECEKARKS